MPQGSSAVRPTDGLYLYLPVYMVSHSSRFESPVLRMLGCYFIDLILWNTTIYTPFQTTVVSSYTVLCSLPVIPFPSHWNISRIWIKLFNCCSLIKMHFHFFTKYFTLISIILSTGKEWNFRNVHWRRQGHFWSDAT